MLSLAVYTLLSLPGAQAFDYGNDPFWVVSHAPLMSTRLDPILSPGSVSSHVHQIIGTSSFSPIYTYENSVAGKCTTGNVGIDKSSYWLPQLYRKYPAGFVMIPLLYANTYYEMRRTGDEPVYEFPPGFRMLAGDATRSTFNATDPTNQAIRYTCLGSPHTEETNSLPPYYCPLGLRAEVYFPHCWDGVNNWLEGSKHVTYGAGQFDQGGACPPTHPKRVMGLFYEFIFEDYMEYIEGARVWATGDDVGYSLHGDFTNGWPIGTFQEIFDYGKTCSVQDAVWDCPPLAPYVTGGPYIPGNGSACNPEGLIVDEDIGSYSGLAALPGDNPLWGGDVTKKVDPNYQNTESFIYAAAPIPDGWTRVGCIAEPPGSRALTSASTHSPLMTPTFCMAFCAFKGFSIAGVEFGDECYCGNTLTGTSLTDVLRTDSCGMDCAGTLYGRGLCGGSSNLTVYQYTGSGTPVVANKTAYIQPSGTGAPTQIIASEIREDSVSGDTGYTYTTYSVIGSSNEMAVFTPSASSTTVTVTPVSTTTTVASVVPALVANGSIAFASANPSNAVAVLIANASSSSSSVATLLNGSIKKVCSRSRKRGIWNDIAG